MAIVTVGNTRLDHVVKPAVGKIGMRTANSVMSMRPVQKSGIDCPAMVTALAASSRRVSALRAIHTPSGTATIVVTSMAAIDSVIVYGNRPITTSNAGAWNEYDVP